MSSASGHEGYARSGDAGSAALCQDADMEEPGRPLGAARIAVAAGLGIAVFAGTGWLWARYGGTVFFDTLTAGLGTCL